MNKMLLEIRKIIAAYVIYNGSEKEVYEALVEEAEGWKMKLEELEEMEEEANVD